MTDLRLPKRATGDPDDGDGDLRCIEFVELETEYLDGALPSTVRATADRHVAECHGCSVFLDQMRRAIVVTGASPREDVPSLILERLLGVFRELSSPAGGA